MRARLGIFGGTFDPPHLGHLILACEARAQLELSRLLWVLTPQPPHKVDRPISAIEQRLEMLTRALEDEPSFELSRAEMDRPGPHYMLDTIRLLADQNPDADLILLLGGDSLRDLPGWHRPAELVAACHRIGVMRRPGDAIDLRAIEAKIPGLPAKLQFIEAPLLEIASSEIRRRVASRRPFRYYVPAAVYEYIRQNGIYT